MGFAVEVNEEIRPRRVVDAARYLGLAGPAELDAVASILLALRDPPACGRTASSPGAEGSPLVHMVRYFLLGRGDTAPVTREIIRE
ncbi:hypothetical protein [Dactylosporangium sp. NPDC049140]|uniref:hypothetical protein n=1 Tax=Dactylosporangium sp. NPDC049140 TaxID=3155647 RepID=UPI0033F784F8